MTFLCFFTNNVLALNTINDADTENKVETENEYNNEYIIKNYEIDMNVQENNVFDITETITAYFFIPKHGIYRKIPKRNEIVRANGFKSKNNAKITDVYVNNNFKINEENDYKNIIIGDASKEFTGEQTYVIKYKYDIGEDPIKDGDEFYFNLI